jgi:4-hydroxybenzoate polyprenyltransferase
LNISSAAHQPSMSRIKLFLALSRTTHGLLDMATPAFAALLWLGTFPPLGTMVIGLITTFAGYTAVYALNDVVDYKEDKKKLRQSGINKGLNDLDAVWVRHPMAQGMLSFKAGLLWALGWATVAAIGAFLLNPICLFIFLAGCGLEALYCLLLKITHHRVIVSGGVKTSGGMAAIFAVDPSPTIGFLIAFFLLLFFWEIGGQNVPNDWADMEEDRQLQAKTIPVRFGPDFSLSIILASLVLAWIMTGVVFYVAPPFFEFYHVLLALAVAGFLLMLPAWQLFRSKSPEDAMALFNKASYFPLALLGVTLLKVIQSSI